MSVSRGSDELLNYSKNLQQSTKKIVHVKDGNLFHPLRQNRCQVQPGGDASKLEIVIEPGGYLTTPTYTCYQLCITCCGVYLQFIQISNQTYITGAD